MLMRLRTMLEPCAKENLGQVNHQLGILMEYKCNVALLARQRGPGGGRGPFFLSVAPSN